MRLLLLCLGLLLLSACSIRTYSWHQKLTVTVQTPTGEVSGFSVTEVTKTDSSGKFMIPEARGVKSSVRGEAVVLEVTPGRYLFVLLDDVDHLARTAFPQFTYERSSEFRRWARRVSRHRGSGEVPPEDYPMMVTFEDIEDPASVTSVRPNNLVAFFGEGVTLKEMTLEITTEPLTEPRVEDALVGWWNDYLNLQLDGNRLTDRRAEKWFANSLNSSDFKR